MNIEDRVYELLENLKRIKRNTFQTDAHKEKITFYFSLSTLKPEVPFVEILDKGDYDTVTEYILKEIDNSNFVFIKEEYLGVKKFLHVSV